VQLEIGVGHWIVPLLLSRIGLARFVQKSSAALVALQAHVNVWIIDALPRGARADFEIDRVLAGAVDQAMTIGDARLEAGSLARPQQRLAAALPQHHFA